MKFYEDCNVYNVGNSILVTSNFDDFIVDEFEQNTDIFHSDKMAKMYNRFDEQPDDTAHLAEVAGRICYMSYGKGRDNQKEYLDNIKMFKHGSTLEHATINFIITGVSRTLTHELVRHRAGMAFSQLSQRYVDESNVGFVYPPEMLGDLEEQKDMRFIFENHCEVCLQNYTWLLKKMEEKLSDETDSTMRVKRARQLARSVLPNATETKIMVSGNCRAIRHFLEMRGSEHADTEIRRLAVKILRTIRKEGFEGIFSDYEIINLNDGTEAITGKWEKV